MEIMVYKFSDWFVKSLIQQERKCVRRGYMLIIWCLIMNNKNIRIPMITSKLQIKIWIFIYWSRFYVYADKVQWIRWAYHIISSYTNVCECCMHKMKKWRQMFLLMLFGISFLSFFFLLSLDFSVCCFVLYCCSCIQCIYSNISILCPRNDWKLNMS